jgi:hypothetical protein
MKTTRVSRFSNTPWLIKKLCNNAAKSKHNFRHFCKTLLQEATCCMDAEPGRRAVSKTLWGGAKIP